MHIELEIIKVENSVFTLKDVIEETYNLLIEFYGINKPVVGDKITLDERLLDDEYEGYCQPYAFKLVDRNAFDEEVQQDFIGLENKEGYFILRRIYG